MKTTVAPKCVVLIMLTLLMAAGSASCATTGENSVRSKRVLLLYSYKDGLPWEELTEKGLISAFSNPPSGPVELNIEHLDMVRYPDDDYNNRLVDLFRYKYSVPSMDLIVSMEDEAVNFLINHGDELFPGIPAVLASAGEKNPARESMRPNMVQIYRGEDFQGTLELILRLLPDTKKVYIVSGTTLTGKNIEKMARQAFKPYTDRLEFSYLNQFPIKEILKVVSDLPENSVILHLILLKDADGATFVSRDIMSVISRNANAPVFSLWDSYMGYGMVGGMVTSAEHLGKTAAAAGLQILNGKSPSDIAPIHLENIPMFDWRQLKRWNIREDRLPAGSVIHHRQYSFYERYKWYIIGSIVLMAIQTLLTGFLIINRMLRKKAVRALRESEQRYRTLFDQASDGVFIFDMDGRFSDVNQQGCDSLGYTRQELSRMTIFDIEAGIPGSRIHQLIGELGNGKPLTLEGAYKRKNGVTFPVEIRASLFEANGCRYVIALVRDITQRKMAEIENQRLEAQLRQAQKMEAIGTLAGGIAHDFNNILAPIVGYTDLARVTIPGNSPVSGYLQEILKAADRARDLVKQILMFSRHREQEFEPVRLQPIIKETLKLLRASIPSTIEIRQSIDPDCGMVMADPTQIHQIMMNLCTNAYQAMSDTGGILSVSLTETAFSPEFAGSLNLAPGVYLKLEVADSGCGMDQAVQERIFEPYFSTRDKKGGTGLGLAVVHSILKRHHGLVTVSSEPGRGTTFYVFLPRTETMPVDSETVSEPLLPGRYERLLVIDDEIVIVQMLQYMLEQLGYQVTVSTDSQAALEIFQSKPECFDLVITDMTMPKMTGLALAKRLIDLRPDIPIILCTGFSEGIDEEKAKALGIRSYIMKPVSRNKLAAAVRQALDESSARNDSRGG